jgi:hypothetical protein
MDPLSIVASIFAVLQLIVKVLTYLNDVKDAPEDLKQCAIEMSDVYNLLLKLRFRLEEGLSTQGSSTAPWYTAVRTLAVEQGPLDQFKAALETIQTKLTDGGRREKARYTLMWKFEKDEIVSILSRIERLKRLLAITLQMDHL